MVWGEGGNNLFMLHRSDKLLNRFNKINYFYFLTCTPPWICFPCAIGSWPLWFWQNAVTEFISVRVWKKKRKNAHIQSHLGNVVLVKEKKYVYCICFVYQSQPISFRGRSEIRPGLWEVLMKEEINWATLAREITGVNNFTLISLECNFKKQTLEWVNKLHFMKANFSSVLFTLEFYLFFDRFARVFHFHFI